MLIASQSKDTAMQQEESGKSDGKSEKDEREKKKGTIPHERTRRAEFFY